MKEITERQARRLYDNYRRFYIQAFGRSDGCVVRTEMVDRLLSKNSFATFVCHFKFDYCFYPYDNKSIWYRFLVDDDDFDETLGLGKNSKGGNYSSRWRTHLGSDLKD